jgi:hypothetical protein
MVKQKISQIGFIKSARSSLRFIFKFKRCIFANRFLNAIALSQRRSLYSRRQKCTMRKQSSEMPLQFFGMWHCESRCLYTGHWVSLHRTFHLKRNPNNYTRTPFMHKTTKPLATLNSCSRILLLQLMHCLKSVSSQPNTPVFRNFAAIRCTVVVLFGTSFSGSALLNASRGAANDFDAK